MYNIVSKVKENNGDCMTNKKKRFYYRLIIILLILFIPFISIGYSALSTTLNIRGDILSKYINPRTVTFPDEIEEILDNETCVSKYEGEVTDQVGVTTTAKNVYFNKCSNKRNIIFNNMCWQMIRTTETGGIKMIYNGDVVDGKCESTRGDHTGIVGSAGTLETLNANYLYGDSFIYDSTNNTFTLINPETATWSDSTYENLIGKYTCKNTTGICTNLYNVNGYSSNTKAYVSSYSIGNTNYAQIGTSAFNANAKSPAMVGYMFNKVFFDYMKYRDDITSSKYGSSFTYDNSTNTYTLSGTTEDITYWYNQYDQISDFHYTCWNMTGTCNTLSYIYYASTGAALYFNLNDGNDINDLLIEMLSNDNVNRYNSSIKGIIDTWYKQNLLSKTSMLEDSVSCNNRTITNPENWNSISAPARSLLKFKYYINSTDISCLNITDQFALSNDKAKLIYPIGLISAEEFYNIGKTPVAYNLNKTGFIYWVNSPLSFDVSYSSVGNVDASGSLFKSYTSQSYGIRPSISLKNSITFSGGDGSETNPWVVEENPMERVYDKIVNLSNDNTCISKYNNQVTDKYNEIKIANNVYVDNCENYRNLIFANRCWQVVRTTENKGVKLIYNGEVVNGKCESTRGNHNGIVGIKDTTTINGTYLYGDHFELDSNNNFKLINTISSAWSSSTYTNLLGKYTCLSTSDTCSTIYNINDYASSTSAYTAKYSIDSTNYMHIGTSPYNASRYNPALVGYMYSSEYKSYNSAPASNSIFGGDVTYSNGSYTLTDTGSSLNDTHHYTCNTTSTTCTSVRFYFYSNYYIVLKNGKKIDDAINELFGNDSVGNLTTNKYSSNIKKILEEWYRNNLLRYSHFIEKDTVFCNERSIVDFAGWNPTGTLSEYLKFKVNTTSIPTDLYCNKQVDAFSFYNPNAKIDYPIGLASTAEMALLRKTFRATSTRYWLITARYIYNGGGSTRYIKEDGAFISNVSDYNYGVRPVIALNYDAMINGGTGSETDPWIIWS